MCFVDASVRREALFPGCKSPNGCRYPPRNNGRTVFLPRRSLGLVRITNESHENPDGRQYVVTLDNVTEGLMACTCPHHVHRNAFCKHMTAAENATDDGTLDAFPSEDDDTEPEDCDCDGLGGFPCWASFIQSSHSLE